MKPKDESLGGCLRTDCRYRWAVREMPEVGQLEQAEAPAETGARSLRGPNRSCLTCRHRGLPSGNSAIDDDKSDQGNGNRLPSDG